MIQARGQICSNSRAHLLSKTLRSKAPSGPEREIVWRDDMESTLTRRVAVLRRIIEASTAFDRKKLLRH